MSWLFLALGGYFVSALTSVVDKFLLADRIKEPSVYAFFVSLLSLFVLVFIPFGIQPMGWGTFVLFLSSGVLFLYGLVAFYTAVRASEVSRVAPLVGITTAIVAGGVSLAVGSVAGLSFAPGHFFALALLLGGAFLIAFDLPLRPIDALLASTFLAGLFMAFSLLLLKTGYRQADFLSGFVWSRLGIVLGGFTLLAYSRFREAILTETKKYTARRQHNVGTAAFFIGNKLLGALSMLLLTYAAYVGPVTFIQALSGVQYAFVLVLALPLSVIFPAVFQEKLSFWDWFQKAVAIILIGLGMWYAVTQGVDFLFL
jgi:uncharacterized membrane protein